MTTKSLKQPENTRKTTEGFVSLIVVSVLTVVMGLVAVGFAQLTNRELRQASDRELAAQAFYAAEAGLNDARAYLENGGTPFSGCTNWPALGNAYFVNDLSGGSGGAKYSCVSIETTPKDLIYSLRAGESITVKISQANLGKLYAEWENQGQSNSGSQLGNLGTLPQESDAIFNNPATTGVLRVALYPVPNGLASTTNDALAAASRTYFMYPNGGSGTPGQVNYGSNGNFVPGNCKTNNTNPLSGNSTGARYCNSVITGLDGSTNSYYVRLTAEYTDMNVTIQGTAAGNNTALSFDSIQGVIDVTGRGTDVLQRIRARIDLGKKYQSPSYGLQSMVALCKGFAVEIPSQGQYGNIDNSAMPNSDSACAAPNGGGSVGSSAGDQGPH